MAPLERTHRSADWYKDQQVIHTHTHTPTENNTPDTDTHAHDKNKDWCRHGRDCVRDPEWRVYTSNCVFSLFYVQLRLMCKRLRWKGPIALRIGVGTGVVALETASGVFVLATSGEPDIFCFASRQKISVLGV